MTGSGRPRSIQLDRVLILRCCLDAVDAGLELEELELELELESELEDFDLDAHLRLHLHQDVDHDLAGSAVRATAEAVAEGVN